MWKTALCALILAVFLLYLLDCSCRENMSTGCTADDCEGQKNKCKNGKCQYTIHLVPQ